MLKHWILGAAFIGLAASAQAADTPMTFKPVKVELPNGDRMLPDGPGAETANNNCIACHSVGMILNQPAMPVAAWTAEVTKMRTVYKAPLDETDIPVIAAYLASIKGVR